MIYASRQQSYLKKYQYLILINLLFSLTAYSQLIFQDSVAIHGANIIDKGDIENAKHCTVMVNNEVQSYTPYQVKEYKFNNDNLYKSFRINIDGKFTNYFLERIVEGEQNLYYLALSNKIKKFYITENDSLGLIELPESGFRNTLAKYFTNCSTAMSNIVFLKSEKNMLTRFFRNYQTCKKKPLFRTRYGFDVSGIMTELLKVQATKFTNADYKMNMNFGVGFFADIPIELSDFSFHPKIQYRQINMASTYQNVTLTNDVVINYSALSVPLLVRYTYLKQNLSPYLQAGFIYNRAIKNVGTLYEYNQDRKNSILTDITHAQVLNDDMGGFSVGCGLIFNYESHYCVFAEFNYNYAYNLGRTYSYVNFKELSLSIGVQF